MNQSYEANCETFRLIVPKEFSKIIAQFQNKLTTVEAILKEKNSYPIVSLLYSAFKPTT